MDYATNSIWIVTKYNIGKEITVYLELEKLITLGYSQCFCNLPQPDRASSTNRKFVENISSRFSWGHVFFIAIIRGKASNTAQFPKYYLSILSSGKCLRTEGW